MDLQHTAIIDNMYTAKDLQSQENRAWIFFIYLAIAFALASVLLFFLIPSDELKKLSYDSRATLEKMPLLAIFFILSAIAIRFSSRVRMFFYNKYAVDSLKYSLPLLCKFYNEIGVSIETRSVDEITFFCEKPRKPYYVWAVIEAVDKKKGLDGYAVFHYDLSRNNHLWMIANLFVTGSIEECASTLQQISEQINRNQDIFSNIEGRKKRYPVEDIFLQGPKTG